MTPALRLVLLVIAFVCFFVATLGPGRSSWHQLVSAGLAALVASMIQW